MPKLISASPDVLVPFQAGRLELTGDFRATFVTGVLFNGVHTVEPIFGSEAGEITVEVPVLNLGSYLRV
jgi:hypothetical protein